jgi:putative tryptophan/tyrosine transport system substrate-binding protein
MRRREFIAGIGGAVVWPFAVRAQQRPLPLVGYLSPGTPEQTADYVSAFRRGLNEAGLVEGRNVTIEYRFARNARDRLPDLANELVRQHASVIMASTLGAALAAKAATTTIPIVFRSGADAVQSHLVTSFNQPGGNITGINDFGVDLAPKRLGLLNDMLPAASSFASLHFPNPQASQEASSMLSAAAAIGRSVKLVTVINYSEIETAFADFVRQRIDAVVVNQGGLFTDRRAQLVTLAAYHHLPAIYADRLFPEAGGLTSYGSNFVDQEDQAGIYAGRILKGEKPADLPVLRPTRFEFVINLRTAKLLGIELAPTLLARADEVIE